MGANQRMSAKVKGKSRKIYGVVGLVIALLVVCLIAYNLTSANPPEDDHSSDYFFTSGFEAGIAADWQRTRTSLGDIPVLSETYKHSGEFSCKFRTTPTLNFAESTVVRDINATSTLYVRMYVYSDAGINSFVLRDRFYVVKIQDSSGRYLAEVGPRKYLTTDPVRWCMAFYRNSTSSYAVVGSSTITSIPAWTKIEIWYDKTLNLISAAINGVTEITVSPSNIGFMNLATLGDPTQVLCGIMKSSVSATPNPDLDPTTEYEISVYVDDVALGNINKGPYPVQTGLSIIGVAP